MLLTCDKCKVEYLEGEIKDWRCPKCYEVCYPVPEEFTKEDAIMFELDRLPPFKCEHNYYDGNLGAEVIVGLQGKHGVWALSSEKAHFTIQSLLNQALGKYSDKLLISEIDYVMEDLNKSVQFLLSQAVHKGWYLFVPESQIERLDRLDEERR